MPDDFRFSVKLPRTISHQQRLAGSAELLASFAGAAGALGQRLDCVLVQLPPGLALDAVVAAAFFQQLRAAFACTLACEAPPAGSATPPPHCCATRPLPVYGPIRRPASRGRNARHRPGVAAPRTYYSRYSDAQLEQLATELRGRDAWCIFDHTAAGAALPNAWLLKQLLKLGLVFLRSGVIVHYNTSTQEPP